MSKKQYERKRDMEAKLFMLFLHLKEAKKKEYSYADCEKNVVYVFDNYDEFKSYFLQNGFADISSDLLELCRMKTTKRGTIIALKGLCDYTIKKHNMKKELNQSQIDEIHFREKNIPTEKDNTDAPVDANSILEKATVNFFPKDGTWHSHCFRRSNELGMNNLPCHLRDDVWLAKMLQQNQHLFYMSHSKILNFVRTSPFFQEKRHEYELEIVKWQINWIAGYGENWICDENYGGDLVYITPVVDLGVRKGVVDTLSEIGMNKDVIEEGLEKFADLWRERFMASAFRNEYEPVFLSKSQVEAPEEEHKEKWLKMRRYEYYQRHKESVDLYGVVSSDMLMTKEEVVELKKYLDQKHQERKLHIEEVKNADCRTERTLRKNN